MTEPARQSGFAEVNGARLYYEDAGAGQPLVMLHGHLLDSRQWDEQVEPFARHYRVVRYDARGFGRSSRPAEPFAHYEDLRGLMALLGIERAFLMGCSGGGATIVDFALAYPELADALILVGGSVNGFPFPAGEPPPLIVKLQEALARRDIDAAVEYGLQLWTDGPRRPDEVSQAARERTRVMMRELWGRPPSEAEARPLDPPAVGRLPAIHAPTLAIVGAADNDLIQRIADTVVGQVPGARKAVIDDAGHHPNMEHPQEFNRIVLEYLRALR